MGIEESTYDPHDDFFLQAPSYDGCSASTSCGYPQPSSHDGSSMNTRYQHKQRPTYIADNFSSLDQVVSAVRVAGLESSNLILGIDFTEGNEWIDNHSFKHKSLHHIGNSPNPYEQAISIIGRTFASFAEDNLIPCFGFGDASTRDQYVFRFNPDNRYCDGFEEVLARYREIVPLLKLSGPTSFAPLIDTAIDIVERNNDRYHVLVIIAGGQVTKISDTSHGKLSPQEQATINSIVAASHYPLSIVLVGVGDGPWDEMQHFDDNITHRLFDNFQFVNFTKVMSENKEASKKEMAFALAALMDIPNQYSCFLTAVMEISDQDREVQNQQVANRESIAYQRKRPLPPPKEAIDAVCPVCLTNAKDMAFGCGHRTCKECAAMLSSCPMCRQKITTRLRLYN